MNEAGIQGRAGVQHERGAPNAQRRTEQAFLGGDVSAYMHMHLSIYPDTCCLENTAQEGLGASNKVLLLGNLSKVFQVNNFIFKIPFFTGPSNA